MEKLTMRKLKELFRLKYEAKLTNRTIAAGLNISAGTVSRLTVRFREAGLNWPLPFGMDDEQLGRLLYSRAGQTPAVESRPSPAAPDCVHIHQELKHKGVTLQCLWGEYRGQQGEAAYSYSQYCRRYREWKKHQPRSLRQIHKAGEKCFIDYCGPTIGITDPADGRVHPAQIFVAVMGASNYTYAEATRSQGSADWLMSHVRAFEYFGGVPEVLVPDNLKSAVSKACYYDPGLNPAYQQLAHHYNTAVVPARPCKPKDKAKAEAGVQLVERWIMAVLRHETFFSLDELNRRIAGLLEDLNQRPFQKQPGNRKSQFERLDKPCLRPLPKHRFEPVAIRCQQVPPDYHVSVDSHAYSVPHALVRQKVELHLTQTLVRVFHKGKEVALHPRSTQAGGVTTEHNHCPPSHRRHREWSPQRLREWAAGVGESALALVTVWQETLPHPEQSYRRCLGLRQLARQTGRERLEKACGKALSAGSTDYASVASILKHGLEQIPGHNEAENPLPEHNTARGAAYYGGVHGCRH